MNTIEDFASSVIDACETEKIEYMVTGAFAAGLHGIPRSTKDVDVVLSTTGGSPVPRIVKRLEGIVAFNTQIQFDTLTWGKRVVGISVHPPPFKVELFELFDDPFVQTQFARRTQIFASQLQRFTFLPTPEDVIVQKLRWGRSKDLDDARDVLAVQGPDNLDMDYIRDWCAKHETTPRLQAALDGIPPF